MTERSDPGGGGLTGATGDLTPDEADAPFVPGERREQASAEDQGNVTYHQGVTAPAQRGDVGDPGSEGPADDGPTNLAGRESGYGSTHGLSPNDPAYDMEVSPPAVGAGDERPAREPRRGVDDVNDHEERF